MKKKFDLIIIGGGIMGLMTAYYASRFVKNILVLDKSTIINKEASSFGLTRSIRNDYLDPLYATLAFEAQMLWREIQNITEKKFLITCGCLNIAKRNITPDFSQTYALKAYNNLKTLQFAVKKFSKKELNIKFPLINADVACLDVNAGFLKLPDITIFLLDFLKDKKISFLENAKISSIKEAKKFVSVNISGKEFIADKIVITSGRWVNDLLDLIKNNKIRFPITFDKPQECKYYYPAKKSIVNFLPENFPVLAYLDVGIYVHPIFDKERGALKIGYYNPPDIAKKEVDKISSVKDFVNTCLPSLKDATVEEVTDADQCSYDLVKDDNFIIGKIPNFENIFVGAGWRGTGYKFAPLIGKILAQLSLQNRTVYAIEKFSPERFKK